MKKLLIILATVIAVLAGGFFWWKGSVKAPSTDDTLHRFLITKGQGATQVANNLSDSGFIKSPLAFKFYVQLTGKAKKVPAGEFELPKNLTLFSLVAELLSGPREIWVTVPEGLRREEIVEKFVNVLGKKGEEAVSFRQNFLRLSEEKEGYLFPETYLFPREVSAEKVVNKLVATFETKTTGLDLEPNGLSERETLTLASIIERETKTSQERPMVAGIYFNRLEIGMALQADASTQYAIGTADCKGKIDCDWWPILTRADLDSTSPYNTYEYPGLPPGPIANPGIISIKAVADFETSDYLYYIHDADAQIHYAKSLEEHNANVARYLGK